MNAVTESGVFLYRDGSKEPCGDIDKNFWRAWRHKKVAIQYDDGSWWFSQDGQKRNLAPKGKKALRKINTADLAGLHYSCGPQNRTTASKTLTELQDVIYNIEPTDVPFKQWTPGLPDDT